VPSLPPSLKRWVARRVQQDRIVKTAYNKLVKVRHILASLQPSLPSSRFSTPASLQAAFLQPAAQQALLLFYRQNKAGRKAGTTVGNALMSFKTFLQIARPELREGGNEGEREDRVVAVGGRDEEWEGWQGEEGVGEVARTSTSIISARYRPRTHTAKLPVRWTISGVSR